VEAGGIQELGYFESDLGQGPLCITDDPTTFIACCLTGHDVVWSYESDAVSTAAVYRRDLVIVSRGDAWASREVLATSLYRAGARRVWSESAIKFSCEILANPYRRLG